MKKTLCIILALCLVLALGACSKAPAAQASPGNAAPAGQQSAAVSDTSTVAVGAVILARDDVNEDEIYALVSTIFENVAAITQQHAKGGELDLAFASGVTSVPYHPGAAKYFQEKGFTVASVKEGAGTGAKANLTFGTGGETGTYYGFGSVLANYVSSANDFTVTAVTSGLCGHCAHAHRHHHRECEQKGNHLLHLFHAFLPFLCFSSGASLLLSFGP